MLLAKIKEKLFNRRNKVEIEDVEVKGDIPASIKTLIQENGIAFDKQYIFVDGEVQIVDDIPEDYTGVSFSFGTDGSIYFENYIDGELDEYCSFGLGGISDSNGIHFYEKATVWEVDDDFDDLASWLDESISKLRVGDKIYSSSEEMIGEIITLSPVACYIQICDQNNVTIVNFGYSEQDEEWQFVSRNEFPIGFNKTYLTHSFNELDPTLKQIVEDAIADDWANGVACTQPQWSAITSLLDNSLYIYYNNFSLIKASNNGYDNYLFGVIGSSAGARLELYYDDNDSLLYASFSAN